MKIDEIILSNFRCFSEEPVTIKLEDDLTCFVGNNGSGKTTLMLALKRLFGSTVEDRTITRDDFYIRSIEDYKLISGRKLFIEAVFSFPELSGDIQAARKTCPAFSSVIYSDDGLFKIRMRLEAIWDEKGYEDEVQSKLYWITSPDEVDFGDGIDFKSSIVPQDRKHIRLRYIPAFRDAKTTLRSEIKTLTKMLEDYTEIEPTAQTIIEKASSKLSAEIKKLAAIKTSTNVLTGIWQKAHDNSLYHYQVPKLEATPKEIGELLRSISVQLSPSESGGNRDIDELSDGQISLFYFTLSIALYQIEQMHYAGTAKGFKELDKDIATFTIFAFEEPENHLSPYYLGRVLNILKSQVKNENCTGIITSHSPSVVNRMTRVEQIRHFRQEVLNDDRHSIVKKIKMPNKKLQEEDYKYINQAIMAHPELYFSKVVILGEGDSEEIVIPQLAEKMGFDLDPSFVAFVKLGGKHVNHMWRLLNVLSIPHVTLLDFDLGRHAAGAGRVKYAIKELEKVQKAKFKFPDGVTEKDLDNNLIDQSKLGKILSALEERNIYFSTPLDLDMSMIKSFSACYKSKGTKNASREVLEKAVFKTGSSSEYGSLGYSLSDDELKVYRNLFCTKSKVVSHYEAMAQIMDFKKSKVIAQCPATIKKLIKKCSLIIQSEVESE